MKSINQSHRRIKPERLLLKYVNTESNEMSEIRHFPKPKIEGN